MRLTSPLPDFTNLNHIPDWIMGWIFSKGMDYIQKHYKSIFKPKDFRKKFGWFQIICLGLLAFPIAILSVKIPVKSISRLLFRTVLGIFVIGYGVFKKIEPEKTEILTKKFNELLIQNNVDKKTFIDGLKKI